MKIFLTGGTGFIGSHFINDGIAEGLSIKALRRSEFSIPKIKLIKEPEWIDISFFDVKEEDFIGVEAVVHLAAHSANVPYDTLENCIKYNVNEPLELFRKAYSAGVRRFIVAGTCFEYGTAGERYHFIPVDAPLEPTNSYATSKAMASLAFRQFAAESKVNLSIHRIFQVFGEGELPSRLWPSLKRAAELGEDFPMTKGEQIRDFIDVKDVSMYFVKICLEGSNGNKNFEIFNVGSGNPQSLIDFSKYWWKQWKSTSRLKIGEIPYREGEVMRFVPEI